MNVNTATAIQNILDTTTDPSLIFATCSASTDVQVYCLDTQRDTTPEQQVWLLGMKPGQEMQVSIWEWAHRTCAAAAKKADGMMQLLDAMAHALIDAPENNKTRLIEYSMTRCGNYAELFRFFVMGESPYNGSIQDYTCALKRLDHAFGGFQSTVGIESILAQGPSLIYDGYIRASGISPAEMARARFWSLGTAEYADPLGEQEDDAEFDDDYIDDESIQTPPVPSTITPNGRDVQYFGNASQAFEYPEYAMEFYTTTLTDVPNFTLEKALRSFPRSVRTSLYMISPGDLRLAFIVTFSEEEQGESRLELWAAIVPIQAEYALAEANLGTCTEYAAVPRPASTNPKRVRRF